MPAQPEYAADIILPFSTDLLHMPSLHLDTATPTLPHSSPTPSVLPTEPQSTPLTFDTPPMPGPPSSVLPSPPTSPLHKLAPSQPLSLTVTLSRLSGINVNGHHAQEQEDSLKIGQSDTTLTKKPLQAPRLLDSDDADSDDSDSDDPNDDHIYDPGSKSNTSHRNCAFDQGGNSFTGDIEDSPMCDNSNNGSSSPDEDTTYDSGGVNFTSNNTSSSLCDNSNSRLNSSHNGHTNSNTRPSDDRSAPNDYNHGSSSVDDDIVYDPGGISGDDFDSGNNTPHTPFPFDNDAADSHHSDDCGHNTKLSTTNNSLGLIKSHIMYDYGGISFGNDSSLSGSTQDGSNTAYNPSGFNIINDDKCMHNPGGDRFNNSIKIDSACDDNESGGDTNNWNLVYNPSGGIHFNNGLGSNLKHNSIKSNASTNNSFHAANASHKNGCSATHSCFYATCHIDPLQTCANHTSYTQCCPAMTAYN